jgi:hypothetical protein
MYKRFSDIMFFYQISFNLLLVMQGGAPVKRFTGSTDGYKMVSLGYLRSKQPNGSEEASLIKLLVHTVGLVIWSGTVIAHARFSIPA